MPQKSSTRTITIWMIVITAIVLIGWDIVVIVNKTQDDTISEVVNDWAYYSLAIPWSLGMVFGHWFLPIGKREKDWPYWVLGGLAAGLLFDIVMYLTDNLPHPWWAMGIAGVAGLLYGGIVWSMRPTETD